MKNKQNVLLALFIAIIAIMSYVPFLGYITTGGISITTLHVPLIIGAVALGKNRGAILGLSFGIFNLIKAYTSGTPEALIFMNPMISVLPRLLAGYCIGLFFEFMNKFENKKGETATEKLFYVIALLVIATITAFYGVYGLAISIIAAVLCYFLLKKFKGKFKLSVLLISIVGTLIHTCLVLICIGIFGASNSLVNIGANIIAIFQTILLINVVFEVLISVLITPIVITALTKAGFVEIN